MKKVLLLILLILPSFSLMLRPGVWTMHDFHLFRQYEFNLCADEGSFPCRWAPDSSLGYGQPLFNFYSQFPYWLGQVFIILGFQIIDSVKILFFLSLFLSASSMYLLSSRFWGRLGGLVSALFYVYAPYRAVDVWVRGALPEALAFIFFPLILYFLEKKNYLLLTCSLALLLITHNLSFFMFLPFLGLWWLVRSRDLRVIPAGFGALLLTAFYWLPVVVESRLVNLSRTTADYFLYRLHYTSLRQLFILNTWGYGGSTWGPNDTMSFSAGHLHWILAGVLIILLSLKLRGRIKEGVIFYFSCGLALLALFLTHGKAEFIWKLVPLFPHIQFPWRFLSLSTLFLSLAVGAITKITSHKLLLSGSLVLLLLLNAPFFRPDIWRPITDVEQFSGALWREQISSALTDFWPSSAASVPASLAPPAPFVPAGMGEAEIISQAKGVHVQKYTVNVLSNYAKISFPTVYFPGWTMLLDDAPHPIFPSGRLGLVTARVPQGNHRLQLQFKDTPPRTLGNLISGLSVLGVISWVLIRRHA